MSPLARFALNWGGQVLLVAVVALAACALAYRLRHRRFPFGLEPAATVLAVGSAIAIAMVTLTPQGQSARPGRVQLHPFHSIRGYRYTGLQDLLIYTVGNVALFVPLGFFIYLALRRVMRLGALPAAMALTCLASVTVEILQLPIWSRSSDIDDVITNTLGGSIGAILGVIAYALYRSLRPHLPGGRPDRGTGRRYSYQDTRGRDSSAERTALI